MLYWLIIFLRHIVWGGAGRFIVQLEKLYQLKWSPDFMPLDSMAV